MLAGASRAEPKAGTGYMLPASPPVRRLPGGRYLAPADSDRSRAAVGPLQGLRIIVVEDEAIISLDIESMLSELGAEVVGTAMRAEEAVALAERLKPDILTMDIQLRGERDGISAAIEIYERFGIRSVFASAFSNRQTMARAEPASPLGWISKPIRRSDLAAALAKAKEGRD